MSRSRTGKAKMRQRKGSRSTTSCRDGELAVFDGLCREILATQGRDVLRSGDPLQAEMWASYLVGLWRTSLLIGEPDPAAAIGGRMVSVAKRARTPEAVMSLRALAAVADGALVGPMRSTVTITAVSRTRHDSSSDNAEPPALDGRTSPRPTWSTSPTRRLRTCR